MGRFRIQGARSSGIRRALRLKSNPVLPNLQSLYWIYPDFTSDIGQGNPLDHLQCFLSPTLLALNLLNVPATHLNGPGFGSLPTQSPCLEHLHITTFIPNLKTAQIRSVLSSLAHLESFGFGVIAPESPEALPPLYATELADLPKLRTLSVYALKETHASTALNVQQTAQFPAIVLHNLNMLTVQVQKE